MAEFPDGVAFTCKCGQKYLTIPQLSNCSCNRTNPNPTTPTTTTTTTTATHQAASSFSPTLLSIPLAFGPTHTDHVCAMCGQEGTSTLECPVCYPVNNTNGPENKAKCNLKAAEFPDGAAFPCSRTTPTPANPSLTVPPSDASRTAPAGSATNLTGAGYQTGDDGSGGLFSRGGGSTPYGVGRSNNTRGANSAALASATGGSTSSNVPTTTDSDLRRRFRRVRQVPAPVFPPVVEAVKSPGGVLTKSSQNQLNKIKEYIKSDASGMVKQIVDLLMKENFLEWSTTTGCQKYKHRNTGWLALKLLADTIFHPEATTRRDRAKSMDIGYGDQSWKDGTERLVALDYIVEKEKEKDTKKKQINKNGNKSTFVTMTTERSPSFFGKLRPISPHYTSPHPLSSVARRLSIPTDILPPDDASIDASPTSPGAYSVPENSDDALDAVMEDVNEDVGLSTQSTEANATDLASDDASIDASPTSPGAYSVPENSYDAFDAVMEDVNEDVGLSTQSTEANATDLASDAAMADSTIRKPEETVENNNDTCVNPLALHSSFSSPGYVHSPQRDGIGVSASLEDTSVAEHSSSGTSPGCEDSSRHDDSIDTSTAAAPDDTSVTTALEDYDDNGNDFPHDYQSLYTQLLCTEEEEQQEEEEQDEEQQEEVEQNTIPDLIIDGGGGGGDGGDDGGDGGSGNGGMSLTPPVSEEEEEQQEEVEQNTIPDLVVDGGGGGGGGDGGGGNGGMSLTPPVSEEEVEQQEEVEQNTIPDLVVDGGGGGGGGDGGGGGGGDGGGSGGGGDGGGGSAGGGDGDGDGDESPVAALEDTFRPENMVGDGDDAQTDRVEQDYRSTIAALEDEYFQKMMRPWL